MMGNKTDRYSPTILIKYTITKFKSNEILGLYIIFMFYENISFWQAD